MIKKKLTFLLLSLAVLIAPFTLAVSAESNKPTISVGSTSADAGDKVSVDVLISGNPGICSFILGLKYDTSRLEFESATLDGEVGGFFESNKRLVWVTDKDTDYNGKYLTLNFTVLKSAQAGKADVTVTYSDGDICNYNEEDVTFDVVPGVINIEKGGDPSLAPDDPSGSEKDSSKDVVTVVAVAVIVVIAVAACLMAVIVSKKKSNKE